jgi:F-type H+-transporting ATPase subunit a
MAESPLTLVTLFYLGPVPITRPVVTTWIIMAVLTAVAFISTRRLSIEAGRWQAVIEIVITTVEQQITECVEANARRYLPFIATLFIFLCVANLSGTLPGIKAPTASLETDVALGLLVLVATQFYGIRAQGLRGYLHGFIKPTPIMLPLNLVGQLTRTFSLMVRLFGNIMSGELVIGIIVSLAGLLLPIPLMLLEVLVGVLQAYIFSILATVFIGSAASGAEI